MAQWRAILASILLQTQSAWTLPQNAVGISIPFLTITPSIPPEATITVSESSDPTVTVIVDDPDFDPATLNPPAPLNPLKVPVPPITDGMKFQEQPAECSGNVLTENCFGALSKGGYLYFASDSGCNSQQKDEIQEAFVDATRIAWNAEGLLNRNEKLGHGVHSSYFWMGSNVFNQKDRVQDNIRRVADFMGGKAQLLQEYITISCKDKSNLCNKDVGSKLKVGGYAESVRWFFHFHNYYHYITLCDLFFEDIPSLTDLTEDMQNDVDNGRLDRIKNMTWLKSKGSMFLHEMMHLRVAVEPIPPHPGQPFIDDWQFEGSEVYAYGPKYVRQLARTEKIEASSRNADSYTMLMNGLWWWDATGMFPDVPGTRSVATSADGKLDTDYPVMLHLANEGPFLNTDLSANYTALLANYNTD